MAGRACQLGAAGVEGYMRRFNFGFGGFFREIAGAVCGAFVLGFLHCAAALPPCFVELPVYDPEGNKLSFRLTSAIVPADEGGTAMDLRSTTDNEYRSTVVGDRLYFPLEAMIQTLMSLTFEDNEGNQIRERVALVTCEQRTSFRYGTKDSGIDGGTELRGRVAGCAFSGDWWVRAMPMFGGFEGGSSCEGFVRPTDGVFSLMGMFGERQIVVFGKGKRPVKAVAADVVQGDVNDMGVVDLRGSCPL